MAHLVHWERYQGALPWSSLGEQKTCSFTVRTPVGYQLMAPEKGELQSEGKDAV